MKEYNSSIMAGHKLRPDARTQKEYIGTIDGKKHGHKRKPERNIGKGMEAIRFNVSSEDFYAIEAYANERGLTKSAVIREWINKNCESYYMKNGCEE